MTYVIDIGCKFHTIVDEISVGRYTTVCQQLLNGTTVELVMVGDVVCDKCLHPETLVQTVAAAPRKRATGRRPQWRPSRDRVREARETLQHAHRALVAAIEWGNRGEESQFEDNVLDQAHLAYRFLGELLVKHKRIEPPDDFTDE